ncbi:MAG TPA: alpha/beta hydrolase [Gemmataceae bacterium]|nr:alpha/beta hydrolase [Gemmataceae bacterium]
MDEASRCDAVCNQPCELACPDVCAMHAAAALPPIDLDDALHRFECEAVQGICATGGYRMPYFIWGDGPPLLFVHGAMDSSRAWIMAISRLSAHFRCLAYDLPNGRDDGARLGRYSHADLVRDLWALLDHLHLDRAYVLGSSFGSTIALTAMRERPDRLPRAVLQGGLALRPLRRLERFLARLGWFLPGTTGRLPLREKVTYKVNGRGFHEKPERLYRFFAETTGRTPVKAFAHQALLLDRVDLRPILPEVRQPVLLFCGDLDVVVRAVHAEILLSGLPNARRVVVEGCGHVPGYSHPEVLAEVVRQFLTPPG